MKLFIRDISALIVSGKPRVRFSITFAEDNGEPVATVKGWTLDQSRAIRGPATRTRMGMYFPIADLREDHAEKIALALEGMKKVVRVLGPNVEGVTTEGNEKIEGELEID